MFAKIADYSRVRKLQNALDARIVFICCRFEAAIFVT